MAKRPNFFKKWRKHRGLTQDQLAERIGINQGHLSKIENGNRPYDQAFLEAMADELRCEPADLLERDPTVDESLWALWREMTAPERRRIVAVIKTLKATGTDG